MHFELKAIFRNENGLTLLEVVASIVIITIILLMFSTFFVQANKHAAVNNEKLVVVNLADATLAKIQAKSYSKVPGASIQSYFDDPDTTKLKINMDPPEEIKLNGKTYTITYNATQSNVRPPNSYLSEKELDLIKVVVTVESEDGKIKGVSEGYVALE